MKFRLSAFALVLASLTLIASASEANKFNLIYTSNNKSIGHASYSISKTKTGLKLTSTFDVVMNNGGVNDIQLLPGDGVTRGGSGNFLDAQYSSDYKLNPDGTFASGYTQSSATQTILVLEPDKARDAMTVRQTRAGSDFGSQTVTLANPDFFLLPNYDPGALQVLITSALAHPHPHNSYLVVIPANPDLGQNNNSPGFTTLTLAGDASGTLDGKPMALKHYTIAFRDGNGEIYTDGAGNLMEALIGSLHASYVRNKFALTPAS